MFTAARRDSAAPRILVVRLGAMGDILHALPAAASLKHSFPGSHLTWAVEPQWAALLEDNPFLDGLALIRRGSPAALLASARELRAEPFDFAVDFQGLLKSALIAGVARCRRIFGFHQSQLRERAAGLFYSDKVLSQSAHVVDRNLELAAAAGASSLIRTFPLPVGRRESELPERPYVLACPLAGWRSKQWPLASYIELGTRLRNELGIPLVLDGPSAAMRALDDTPGAVLSATGLPGLIYATRRAAAVIGVDSGPLHLAAALGKPGVAIFGPTDPARNGPYGDTFTVLRAPGAETSYKRRSAIDPSMHAITPDAVFEALKARLACHSAGCLS
jgi:heptosyltransferase-1